MPDENARRYLFVAIDRATRWVYLSIHARRDEAAATDFLCHLNQAAPMRELDRANRPRQPIC